MKKIFSLFLCFLSLIICPLAFSQPTYQQEIIRLIKNGAVLALDEKGEVLFSYHADQPFVPASTLKVATALAALKILGEDYRFKTEFLKDASGNLYIKGYGDPFLVSEELMHIAEQLKGKGLREVQDIVLDGSYFDKDVQVSGLSGSLNPYDAYNGALLANFNTIYINKKRDGMVESAEAQTPITEITRQLAKDAPVGKSRINVAMHEKEASQYVGYLLKEFLRLQGVSIQGDIRLGKVPSQVVSVLNYSSSKNLKEVLQAALEYSQNLIMNQILLTMGAEKLGPPASLQKGKKVLTDFLTSEVGLKNFHIEEGSGISRENQIAALEMDKVLVKFFRYYKILPIKNGMWVKTGTLRGVSGLIGYFQSSSHGWVRFVILLNQDSNHREKIADLLFENL